MKKIKPNKYTCFILLLIPLVINAIINYSANEDIWYMMRYGKIILERGFIHTDILSIHSGLHIVIQQSFTNILFYLLYKYFSDYGLFLLCELMIGLYLFFIYKICMLLSNNKKLLSISLASITCILLEVFFITPRPQLFTYLNILIIIYIMELFYKNNKTKAIYFLPLISLLQINFHGVLWCFIFVFILPYAVQLIIDKNNIVFKLLLVMLIMYVVGFINPYTYENVFFPFLSYDPYIKNYIDELRPACINFKYQLSTYMSLFFYSILTIELLIYIYYKKGKIELRHLLLFGGTIVLSILNVRSIALFILVSIPILSNYMKTIEFKRINYYFGTNKTWIIVILYILLLAALNPYRLESVVKEGGDYLNKNYDKDIIIYSKADYGPYIEYLGFHTYMDTRAEVFTKKANKKVELYRERVELEKSCTNYKGFIKKYNFTHIIVDKYSCLYYYLKKDKVKIVFEYDTYVIFEL